MSARAARRRRRWWVDGRPGLGAGTGRGLVALLVLVLGVLSGCATMPRSGPVQQGDPDVTEPGSIALLARLPVEGDSPEEIVDGFLRAAAAGLTDDFAIAREFLSTSARSSWNPLARVDVYSGQAELGEISAGDVIRVSAALAAVVDSGGRYTEAVPGTGVALDLALGRAPDGEWRITDLEDGILLSEPIFRSLFQQTPLYFVAPDGAALVSETRWFPRRTVETAAVGALLAGPSAWLAEGVVSAFPPGTRLMVDTVTVRDGTAQVDLSAEALDAPPAQRTLLIAQLSETLVGLPRVQSVRVTAGGVEIATTGRNPDLLVDPSVGSSPVVLADGALRAVEGGQLVALGPAEGPLPIAGPSQPALPYGSGVAVVLSEGTAVVTAPVDGGPAVTLLAGDSTLTAPSYDRLGWIWTSPVTGTGVVRVVRPDGARLDVSADWLEARDVRSLRISRDGARALVVSVGDGSVLVEVAAVVRDADGRPVALGEALRVGQRITAATTAVWVDQQTVAVLGRVGSGSTGTVVLVPVGGPTTSLPAVEGAVALTSGKGDRLLFVSTVLGELFARNGLGWTSVVAGVRDPAFPG